MKTTKVTMILAAAVAALAAAALSSCAASGEDPIRTKASSETTTDVPEAEQKEEVEVWVDPVFKADILIYESLDEACGTSLAEKASIQGSGTDASGNSSFIGFGSAAQKQTECILDFTETSVSWEDLETGVEEPVFSSTEQGGWGVRGTVNTLGDEVLVTLNLYYLKTVQEGHFALQK